MHKDNFALLLLSWTHKSGSILGKTEDTYKSKNSNVDYIVQCVTNEYNRPTCKVGCTRFINSHKCNIRSATLIITSMELPANGIYSDKMNLNLIEIYCKILNGIRSCPMTFIGRVETRPTVKNKIQTILNIFRGLWGFGIIISITSGSCFVMQCE